MAIRDPDKLADLVAALGEFATRLGLGEDDQAALRGEVDALRVHMLWQPDSEALAAGLRKARAILASAPDSPLARGVMEEIDALLAEA
jgi:hypothetical protein